MTPTMPSRVTNRDVDPSIWNDGGVSLHQLMEALEGQGYAVEYIPGPRWPGESFVRPGDDAPFTEEVEEGILQVDGVDIPVQRVFSWHGGMNSGHPTEDVGVRRENEPA